MPPKLPKQALEECKARDWERKKRKRPAETQEGERRRSRNRRHTSEMREAELPGVTQCWVNYAKVISKLDIYLNTRT